MIERLLASLALIVSVLVASAVLLGAGSAVLPGAMSVAHAQGPYAGTWNAGALRTQVEVASWGRDCGQRPASGSAPAPGAISVTQSGDHLTIPGSPTRRTNACWSENRLVQRISSTYQGGVWRTTCRTPRDDSRQEEGTYTVRAASDDRLELTEVSRYSWQLNTSSCQATVTISQVLTRAGGSTNSQTTPPPNERRDAAPPEPARPRCTAGAPARIRVRPEDLAVEPGGEQCFRAQVTDAAGCAIDNAQVAWEMQGSGGTLSGACFRAGTATSETPVTIVARSGALRGEARLRVQALDLSAIIARRSGIETEGTSSTATATSTSGAGGVAARAEGVATGINTTAAIALAGGAGALVLLALVLGIVAVRRRRAVPPPPAAEDEWSRPMAQPEAAKGAPPSADAAPGPAGEPKICPMCRRGFAATDTRCPTHGEVLVAYSAFAKGSSGAKVCPTCGERYPAEITFCGKDGTSLKSPG